jgi:hypothetical protein
MEISFTEENGKNVVLRGMIENTSRVVITKRMEAIFRRGYISYGGECRISVTVDKKGETHYSPDIQRIIDRNNKFFEPIPLGEIPTRGFEHIIDLEEREKTVITTPYRHPNKYKAEI